MTLPSFAYPVIGFERGGDFAIYGGDEDFEICFTWEIKKNVLQGMLLVDNRGKTWEVLNVKPLRRAGGFWRRVLDGIGHSQRHDIEYELAETSAMTLDEVKNRVCAGIDRHPYQWVDEDSPKDVEALLGALKSRVLKGRDLREILGGFGEET